MLNLDNHPSLPSIPQYSQDLETFLVSSVRPETAGSAHLSRLRPRSTRGWLIAATPIAVAAVAVAVVAGVNSGAPSRSQSPSTGSSSSRIQLTGFSVAQDPGGTVTLTVTRPQILDPAALTKALANAGVPALVTVGSVCVAGPSPVLGQVISPPHSGPGGAMVTTITPSAIPAGMELSIGYFDVPKGGVSASAPVGVHVTLVPVQGPMSCASTPPPLPHN